MIVGCLSQFAGQTVDVVGTLLHAGCDIVHLVSLQAVTAGGKHLCKATDNIQRCTYLVIHGLDEGGFATVGVKLELIGLGQLGVERGEFSIEGREFLGLIGQLLVGCGQFVVGFLQGPSGGIELTVATMEKEENSQQ